MKALRIVVAVVVVAVAGVITLVMSQKQSDDARRVASARNLQQWGIALNLHLIDHENQLPEPGETPIEESQEKAWYNALPPYISQTPLAKLPPGERPRPGVPSLWIDPSTKPLKAWDPAVFYFNYAMNGALQPDPKLRSFKIYELTVPGNVVFLSEVDGYSPICTPEDVVFRHGGVPRTSPDAMAHVLFCDGHVQLVSRKVLVTDPQSRSAAAAETGPSWYQN